MAGILTFALHYEGQINKNSQGAVSEAAKLSQQLGTDCHAVVVGEGISDDAAASLGKYGATMEVTQLNVADGKLTAGRPILGDSSISTSIYKDHGIIIGRLNAFEI